MQFLAPGPARNRATEIRAALNELLSTKALVTRRVASQWRFLEACVERLLSGKVASEFQKLETARAAQLKFEVEDRLRAFTCVPASW